MNIVLFTNSNIGISLYTFLIKHKVKIKLVVCGNYQTLIQFKFKNVTSVLYNKKKLDKITESLINNNIDLGVVACFTILPKKIWNLPKYKMINMHYSLLYSYAGPNPVQWQIHNKEKKTGVTVHFITNKIDQGKIVVQKEILMPTIRSSLLVYKKLKPVGQKSVLEAINLIKNNKENPPIIQPKYPYTYYSFYKF